MLVSVTFKGPTTLKYFILTQYSERIYTVEQTNTVTITHLRSYMYYQTMLSHIDMKFSWKSDCLQFGPTRKNTFQAQDKNKA